MGVRGVVLGDGDGDSTGADLAVLSSDGSDESSGDDGELHFVCCWWIESGEKGIVG